MLGILITLSIPLLVVSLSLNGVGIGGQQVVGVVDALHEANKVSRVRIILYKLLRDDNIYVCRQATLTTPPPRAWWLACGPPSQGPAGSSPGPVRASSWTSSASMPWPV